MESVFELFPFAVIRVASDLTLLAANQKARHSIELAEGLYVRQNRLLAWQPRDDIALGQAVRVAARPTDARSSQLVIRRSNSPIPQMVSVVPVASANPGAAQHTGGFHLAARSVSLVFQDAGAGWAGGLDHLADAFGITAAEARLAGALMNAESLQAYGKRQGVTLHTLRSHMAALFRKTGTRRQAELVRLLMLMRPLI